MIVLDTHVLIWMIEGGVQLGDEARQRIETARIEDGAIVPAICTWEIALLADRGRVELSLPTRSWIDLVLATPGFALAALEPAIAVRTVSLPWDHRDPADRMIVATAIEKEAPVLTVDRAILAYAAAGHLKAIDARL